MEPHLRSNTEPREPIQENPFCSSYQDAYPPPTRNSMVCLRYFHRGSLHGKAERAAVFGKLQPPCFPRLPRAGRSSSRAPRALPQLAHVTLIDSPARRSPSHRPSAAACQSQRLTAPHWLACAPRSSSGSAALGAHRTRWRRWGAGGWAEKRALRGRGRWAGRSPALAVAGPRQRPTLVRRTRLAERPRLRPRPRRPWRSQPPPLDSGGALVC